MHTNNAVTDDANNVIDNTEAKKYYKEQLNELKKLVPLRSLSDKTSSSNVFKLKNFEDKKL